MSNRTDSCIVEYNDDGSRTVTTVETIHPVTKKQQAAAFGVLGLLALAPAAPLLVIYGLEKWDERKAKRAEAKKLKSV
jgi:hypothetical protein